MASQGTDRVISSLLDDTLDMVDFLDLIGKNTSSPERRLACALLLDAIEHMRTKPNSKVTQEAIEWLTKPPHPYSFKFVDMICIPLELDAKTVIRKLEKQYPVAFGLPGKQALSRTRRRTYGRCGHMPRPTTERVYSKESIILPERRS